MPQTATLAEQAAKLETSHKELVAALLAYVEYDQREGMDGKLRTQGERALARAGVVL